MHRRRRRAAPDGWSPSPARPPTPRRRSRRRSQRLGPTASPTPHHRYPRGWGARPRPPSPPGPRRPGHPPRRPAHPQAATASPHRGDQGREPRSDPPHLRFARGSTTGRT